MAGATVCNSWVKPFKADSDVQSSIRASKNKPTGPLDQGAHGGAVGSPLDEIPLPMPRHQTILDLGRTNMNEDVFADKASLFAVGASRSRPAIDMPLAQAGNQFAAQLAARQGI